jgi:hypothetical protein
MILNKGVLFSINSQVTREIPLIYESICILAFDKFFPKYIYS